MIKPYAGVSSENWSKKTEELIRKHPLNTTEIVEIILQSWEEIFKSSFGSKKFKIGKDIFPKPQIMGFILEELVALEISKRHSKIWKQSKEVFEKDLVCIKDSQFSIEMKVSSSKRDIFGNRSYAQKITKKPAKKSKDGYYLAINFEKFDKSSTNKLPKITLIRFGWLDHADWTGQKEPSGQNARLSKEVKQHKLITLYPKI